MSRWSGAEELTREYARRRRHRGRRRPCEPRRLPGRTARGARPVGLGQDHAAQPARRARSADLRPGGDRRARPHGDLPRASWSSVRRQQLGYVFQGFGLIPVLSAAENVEVPLRIQGVRGPERAHAGQRDARPGRAGRPRRATPRELSGGQQQRVGLARALAARPTHPARRRAHRPARQRHRRIDDGSHERARALRGHRGDRLDPRPDADAARRPRGRAARRPYRRARARTARAPVEPV